MLPACSLQYPAGYSPGLYGCIEMRQMLENQAAEAKQNALSLAQLRPGTFRVSRDPLYDRAFIL